METVVLQDKTEQIVSFRIFTYVLVVGDSLILLQSDLE